MYHLFHLSDVIKEFLVFPRDKSIVSNMAELLTSGGIKKIVSGECPESFTFQVGTNIQSPLVI